MGFRSILDNLAAAWRAAIRAPKEWIAWVRANPSRVVAAVWIAGMCTFLWIGYRRAYRKHLADVAAEAPEVATRPKPPPEVVQMLDVDELEQIRIDRLHELGLAAEGEDHAPDPATVKKAREARQKTVAAEGEKVFGDGDVVVVTKGGIEGWIKRNKDKKPDPETLAWLRGEEKKDGIKAYAAWADDGHGNSIAGWLERGQKKKAEAVAAAPAAQSGSGSGSGSGFPARPKLTTVEDMVAAPEPAIVVDPTAHFDAYAIGVAALSALDPVARPHHGAPTAVDAEVLRTQLAVATPRLEVIVRGGRLVIDVPREELLADDALSDRGRALAHALGGLPEQDFLIATDDPDATMAIAAAMAVAGVQVTRISIGAIATTNRAEIALIGRKP